MAEEKPKKTKKQQAEEAAAEETPAAEAEAPVEEAPADEPVAEETEAAVEEAPAEEPAPAPEETPEPEAPTAEETTPAAEAPETEASPGEEPEAAPAAPSKPAKSQKHLPRSARRQRVKPKRVRPKERKPIVRLEKPSKELGRRQERRGVVVSDAMDKTIVVEVDVLKMHPKYKKVIKRSRKFHAHDAENRAKVGDVVRIVETRPLSRTKNWRLAEVVEVAK